MTDGPIIQGWCPGALRPMMSGDGLVVRIRPAVGRLTQTQARGIATLASNHGNGLIDLSNRANLQLRGVTETSHPALIDGLQSLGLIDPTPEAEARRNIIVTPFWTDEDPTQNLTAELTEALATAPHSPVNSALRLIPPQPPSCATPPPISGWNPAPKVCSSPPSPVQNPSPAIPPSLNHKPYQLVRPKRHPRGQGPHGDPSGTHANARRLQRPALARPNLDPSLTPQGQLIGFDFGQMQAETLATLADLAPLRLTPWRMLLIESHDSLPKIQGVLTDPNDPMLRVIACSGAPACASAHQPTRDLARALAPQIKSLLHIAGCAKGCAHPAKAPLTLTATAVGFDLISDGSASGVPDRRALSAKDLIANPTLVSKVP